MTTPLPSTVSAKTPSLHSHHASPPLADKKVSENDYKGGDPYTADTSQPNPAAKSIVPAPSLSSKNRPSSRHIPRHLPASVPPPSSANAPPQRHTHASSYRGGDPYASDQSPAAGARETSASTSVPLPKQRAPSLFSAFSFQSSTNLSPKSAPCQSAPKSFPAIANPNVVARQRIKPHSSKRPMQMLQSATSKGQRLRSELVPDTHTSIYHREKSVILPRMKPHPAADPTTSGLSKADVIVLDDPSSGGAHSRSSLHKQVKKPDTIQHMSAPSAAVACNYAAAINSDCYDKFAPQKCVQSGAVVSDRHPRLGNISDMRVPRASHFSSDAPNVRSSAVPPAITTNRGHLDGPSRPGPVTFRSRPMLTIAAQGDHSTSFSPGMPAAQSVTLVGVASVQPTKLVPVKRPRASSPATAGTTVLVEDVDATPDVAQLSKTNRQGASAKRNVSTVESPNPNPLKKRKSETWMTMRADVAYVTDVLKKAFTAHPHVLTFSFFGLSDSDLRNLMDTTIPQKNHKFLRQLDLNNNRINNLTDHICKRFEHYNICKLDLSCNKLTSIPDSISLCKNIRFLNLSGNGLANLPDTLGDLKLLQVLDLSRNKIKTLPNGLGRLLELEVFSLAQNHLASLPDDVSENGSNLISLDLSSNECLKSLPSCAQHWAKLDYLEIGDTALKGILTAKEATLKPFALIKAISGQIRIELKSGKERGQFPEKRNLVEQVHE